MPGLLRWINKILIISILLLGVLAVLVRLATPLLEHSRESLEKSLSQQFNTPISIKHLRSSWYGVSPALVLQEVQIGAGEQALRLHEARLDLTLSGLAKGSLLDSLRLTLDKLHLHVQRDNNGKTHIVGLPISNQQGAGLQLPSQLRLTNTRLYWHDLRVQAEPLIIDQLNVELRRNESQLQLRGNLNSPLGTAIFSADINGYLSSTDWSGSSYLKVNQLQLAELLQHYIPAYYRIDKGTFDMQIWQQWKHALPVSNKGSLYLTHTQLSNTTPKAHQVTLDNLSTDFSFQRDSINNWTLELNKLQLQTKNNTSWPESRIVAQLKHNNKSAQLSVAADFLAVDDIANLLLIRPPDAQIEEALLALQPQGFVENLRFQLPLEDKKAWQLSADIKQLQNLAWKNIPGINHLDGKIAAQQNQAQLVIDSKEMVLDYRSVFRDTHNINTLNGSIYWQAQNSNEWMLYSHNLTLNTPDFTSKTQFQFKQQKATPPHLYIQGEMYKANVEKVSRYLPAKVMGPATVNWLDKSLSTGIVNKATLLIDGPLDNFPYIAPRNGVFEIVVDTQETALNYQEGWPALSDISAKITFHGKSLDIEASKGQIFNSQIQQVYASISDLPLTSPLELNGHLSGPLADHLSMLQTAPLRDDFGEIGKALKAKGQADLKIIASIPLDEGIGKHKLDGKLIFKKAYLELPEWDLPLDKIDGQLNMTLTALHAKGIKAEALGTKINVDVVPQKNNNTHVIAYAKLNKKALTKRLPEVPLDVIDGDANFSVLLDIPSPSAKQAHTALIVKSDLLGMQVNLPAPLGKSAQLSQDLSVRIPLSGKNTPIKINYANELKAHFSPDWKKGDIRFLAGNANLTNQKGYQFKGNFNRLDIAAWQEASETFLPSQPTNHTDWRASLNVKKLQLGEIALDNAKIDAQSSDTLIKGKIVSKQVSGNLQYSLKDDKQLTINLDKAHLYSDSNTDSLPPKPNGPDPSNLPAMTLNCSDLKINQANLGRLSLSALPANNGLEINRINLRGGEAEIDATGTWMLDDHTPYTSVNGTFKSKDMGNLLHNLGYPRQIIDAAANSEFDFSWIGHPGQAHKETLLGTLDLAISKGRLSKLDPGLGHVLGLLSLNSLGRRLKLDFGDVLKKGYSFDSIVGSFRLEEGNAYTNDLYMNGPSGRINIGGRIGLASHDLDQLVQVTPNIDATLPIASTLAGGPVAGIAALLAQKLLSDEVDKINRFEYSVSGSWEDPKIVQLDSGGGLSKLINTLSGKKTQAKTKAQESLLGPQKKSSDPINRLINSLEPTESGPSSEFDTD